MHTGDYIVTYLAMSVVFFVLDMLWLGLLAKKFYQSRMAGFSREKVLWPAALVFYALYVVGIMIFCVSPALRNDSAVYALAYGALFGLFAYATYNLTNLATVKNWPRDLLFVDIPWGMALTGVVAVVGLGVFRGLG
jgi:uncharacterized membrane protein